MQLLQRLLEQGLLTEDDVPRINEARAATPTKSLHEVLIEKGFAKEEDVLAALAEEFGMELVDLTQGARSIRRRSRRCRSSWSIAAT